MASTSSLGLSRGFYFTPTDEDLMEHLQVKVAGKASVIPEMNLYSTQAPWEMFDAQVDDEEYYCFTTLKKKSSNCPKRMDRTVSNKGTWKATQPPKKILHPGNKSLVLGIRRAYNFTLPDQETTNHDPPPPTTTTTNNHTSWIMHEYTLPPSYPSPHQHSSWAVCKIKKHDKPLQPSRTPETPHYPLPSQPPDHHDIPPTQNPVPLPLGQQVRTHDELMSATLPAISAWTHDDIHPLLPSEQPLQSQHFTGLLDHHVAGQELHNSVQPTAWMALPEPQPHHEPCQEEPAEKAQEQVQDDIKIWLDLSNQNLVPLPGPPPINQGQQVRIHDELTSAALPASAWSHDDIHPVLPSELPQSQHFTGLPRDHHVAGQELHANSVQPTPWMDFPEPQPHPESIPAEEPAEIPQEQVQDDLDIWLEMDSIGMPDLTNQILNEDFFNFDLDDEGTAVFCN